MKPAANAARPERRRVFLVDDHPLVREWLASLMALEPDLEICGQTEDAAAALAALALARPDAIVVDLSLPRSSGLELIKDVKVQFPAMRILVLSMIEEVSVVERALRSGAHGYVVKRESGAKIVEALRAVLDGKFYANPGLTTELAGRMFGGVTQRGGNPDELLSDREMEVFRMRGQGRKTRQIAEFLKVSIKTVGSYDERIKVKLGLEGANAMIREAVLWNDRRHGV
jgi:DNA-binding NarL/FixJ family response regulator